MGFALLCAALPCQVIVVNPSGGGNFTDLQAAINAAPTDAVIHVVGGSYPPITITRSITIVGNPMPQIVQPPGDGSGAPSLLGSP